MQKFVVQFQKIFNPTIAWLFEILVPPGLGGGGGGFTLPLSVTLLFEFQ